MQHHNTPLPHINLSPVQILLHRQLRYYIPDNPKHYKQYTYWIISTKQCEQVLAEHNRFIPKNYLQMSVMSQIYQ